MFATWSEQDQSLIDLVKELRENCIDVYLRDPNRIEEDCGKEAGIAEGGYGRKQIQELLQNSADALKDDPGRIRVVLTRDALYVANQGAPFVHSGVRALLYTHLSNKNADEIGRFGLGFKSVSGISTAPEIYSRSVSFKFDKSRTVDVLRETISHPFEESDVPSLRLAWTVDPELAFLDDPVLNELSRWAMTIVKLPLLDGAYTQLKEEMEGFDESFCLFAPHVKELILDNRHEQAVRQFSAKKRGRHVHLTNDKGDSVEWMVITKEHVPSAEALDSAGRSARREKVNVSWAFPLEGRAGVGRLSAFFPVMSKVTLSGIINAPWKLSDDRMNVISGPFNYELLTEVLPALVVEGAKMLLDLGQFGRYIDALPARGKESRSWADEVINEPIYDALRLIRSLPSAAGERRSPNQMQLIPDAVSTVLANEWLKTASNLDEWVHPDASTTSERRSKIERLMKDRGGSPNGSIQEWLESIVQGDTKSPSHSRSAIKIAAALYQENTEVRVFNEIGRAPIVLMENGRLQAPIKGRCFIRTRSDEVGQAFIDSAVTSDQETVDALKSLSVTEFQGGGELLSLLTHLRSTGRVNWDELWQALRGSSVGEVQSFFDDVLGGTSTKACEGQAW